MMILAAKLYTPRPPPKVVVRSGLVELLNAGLHHKLTIIAAPAGFGKTTLVPVAHSSRHQPAVALASCYPVLLSV